MVLLIIQAPVLRAVCRMSQPQTLNHNPRPVLFKQTLNPKPTTRNPKTRVLQFRLFGSPEHTADSSPLRIAHGRRTSPARTNSKGSEFRLELGFV